ncbi:Yqey-like protein-domain-containing protein [Entophlyctis helioformis]|nr:Yqey-like protein-domain-containing protein [Entophlyctis helioformis]
MQKVRSLALLRRTAAVAVAAVERTNAWTTVASVAAVCRTSSALSARAARTIGQRFFSTPPSDADAGLKQALKDRLKASMVAKDKFTTTVIKSVLADILNAEKSGNQDKFITVTAIIRRGIKRRQESAAAYRDGGRADLAEAEEAEIRVLEQLLPAQMSEAEIADAVRAVMEREGAKGPADLGRLMKALNAEIDAAVAPRKLVSEVAKRLLSGKP